MSNQYELIGIHFRSNQIIPSIFSTDAELEGLCWTVGGLVLAEPQLCLCLVRSRQSGETRRIVAFRLTGVLTLTLTGVLNQFNGPTPSTGSAETFQFCPRRFGFLVDCGNPNH
jgi:hypothetical protein